TRIPQIRFQSRTFPRAVKAGARFGPGPGTNPAPSNAITLIQQAEAQWLRQLPGNHTNRMEVPAHRCVRGFPGFRPPIGLRPPNRATAEFNISEEKSSMNAVNRNWNLALPPIGPAKNAISRI